MVIAAALSIIVLAVMVGGILSGLLTHQTKINPYALIIFIVVSMVWAGSVFYSWINHEYTVPDALYKIMGVVAGVALQLVPKEVSRE